VRLLLGEIPERKFLSSPSEMRSKLLPYFELTSAVRAGDLHEFALVVEKHKATFEKDNVFNLITRLRRNVIRTGLAKVNVAYSKISLNDIALKLGLQKDVDMNNTTSNNINSEGAIECVVAKAIRDGAVDAQIDFETGIMTSNETKDAYSTSLPGEVFHQRVAYCLDVHNECQRAMRYAEKGSTKTNETKEERMKRLEDEEALREFMEEEDDYF
jgi:26S proteasome regulatory subunit N3